MCYFRVMFKVMSMSESCAPTYLNKNLTVCGAVSSSIYTVAIP